MNRLLALIITLFPLLVFGQAVSRPELRNTNNLIQGRMLATSNALWVLHTNGVNFSSNALYQLIGGSGFITAATATNIANAAIAPATNTVTTNATAQFTSLNPWLKLPWLGMYIHGDSIAIGDPTGLRYTFVDFFTNLPQWRGRFSYFSNGAVSGDQFIGQTQRMLSATTLANWPAVCTNGTNMIVVDEVQSNDIQLFNTNVFSLINMKSNLYVYLKSRGITVVASTMLARTNVGTHSANGERFNKAQFALANFYIQNTNLVDYVLDFGRVLPDFYDLRSWLPDGTHPNTNGMVALTREMDVQLRFGQRPKPWIAERVGPTFSIRNPDTLDEAVGLERDGSYYKQGAIFLMGDTLNTGIGVDVFSDSYLRSGASFINNSAGGLQSQYRNTNSPYNTSFGWKSLLTLYGGNGGNSAFGYNAGTSITTGEANVLFGADAGANVSSGVANLIFGRATANTLTTGDYNLILGHARNVPTAATSQYMDIMGVLFGTSVSGYTGTNIAVGARLGVLVAAPSDTMDVNGTFRVRGISSLNGDMTVGLSSSVAQHSFETAGGGSIIWRGLYGGVSRGTISLAGGGGNDIITAPGSGGMTILGGALRDGNNNYIVTNSTGIDANSGSGGSTTNQAYISPFMSPTSTLVNTNDYVVDALFREKWITTSQEIYISNVVNGVSGSNLHASITISNGSGNAQAIRINPAWDNIMPWFPLPTTVATQSLYRINFIVSGPSSTDVMWWYQPTIPGPVVGSSFSGTGSGNGALNLPGSTSGIQIHTVPSVAPPFTNVWSPFAASSGQALVWNTSCLCWTNGTVSAAITGTDTRVMFFDGANNPAGDAGLTYNKTTDSLTAVGDFAADDVAVGNELSVVSGASFASTVTVGNTVTVSGNTKYAVVLPSITQSNLIVSGSTNTIECVGLTNIVLTNIVEEATGIKSETFVVIRQINGVSAAVVWPAYGAQHGYFFNTNDVNDVRAISVVPPGTNMAFGFVILGSNVWPSINRYPRP